MWHNWWQFTIYTLTNEHGFSGGQEKSARLQEDRARQTEQAQAIVNQVLAQLVPGSQEYNDWAAFGAKKVADVRNGVPWTESELSQQGQQIVSQQQSRIAAGGPATALEARTNLSFQGLRDKAAFAPEEQALLNALRGVPGSGEPGQAGGVQDIFGQLVNRAQDPNAAYTSTLAPQLQLAGDQVKARAAQRGILGSGLELEDLGRTGVELAIREAAAREDFRQQQLQNFQGIFNAGQGLRSREIGIEGELLNLQQGRESRLTDLLNASSFSRASDLADLFQRQTGRAEDLLGQAQAADAGQTERLGQILGASAAIAAAPFTGGASLAFAPAAASAGGDLAGLLGGSRAAPAQGGQAPDLASTLRRSSGTGSMSAEDFAALLRQLNASGVR